MKIPQNYKINDKEYFLNNREANINEHDYLLSDQWKIDRKQSYLIDGNFLRDEEDDDYANIFDWLQDEEEI